MTLHIFAQFHEHALWERWHRPVHVPPLHCLPAQNCLHQCVKHEPTLGLCIWERSTQHGLVCLSLKNHDAGEEVSHLIEDYVMKGGDYATVPLYAILYSPDIEENLKNACDLHLLLKKIINKIQLWSCYLHVFSEHSEEMAIKSWLCLTILENPYCTRHNDLNYHLETN